MIHLFTKQFFLVFIVFQAFSQVMGYKCEQKSYSYTHLSQALKNRMTYVEHMQ